MGKISTYLLAAAGLLSITSNAQNNIRTKGTGDLYPFYHGVASGDPLQDRVVLWTRVTDDTLSVDSVAVTWRIATDTNMVNVVNSGMGYAASSRDWTFKVDADGLAAGEWYYYDFNALGHYSLRGRTKTAPSGDVDSVRLGIVSCSNYEHGYFSPYRHLMDRNDIDCILHLGDYIYEYETGGYSANISGRENMPTNEIVTLQDYRVRHSHYKLDDDLRKLHQQYPFINIWDDHESANDSYKDGAENHDASEGLWSDRLDNSAQAYHEWLPIRSPEPGGNRIYRSFEFGDLINLPMLDTRIEGRDEQGGAGDANDPSRSLLGATQYDWFINNLDNASQRWNIVGQQVMFAPLEAFGTPVNYDQWDGYNYERDQILNFLDTGNIDNFVVLTGDIHTSWVNDIPMTGYDPSGCQNSAGVEFVVTSVTSPSFPVGFGTSLIQSMNDHMQYIDITEKGYGILDVNKTRCQMDYYYMNDIEDINTDEYFAEGWYVNNLETCANQASGFSARITPNAPLAPENPIQNAAVIEDYTYSDFVVIGAYPNPVTDLLTLQVYMPSNLEIAIGVYDLSGKLVYNDVINNFSEGVNYAQLDISDLAIGSYNVVLQTESNRVAKRIVKQ